MVKAIVEIIMSSIDMHGEDIIGLIKEGVQNAFPNFRIRVLGLE